jgi:amino acid adenylation domain-containing protein
MTKIHTKMLESASEFEEAERYWLNKISGDLPDIRLSSDFPGTTKYEKASCKVTFKSDLIDPLIRISKDNDLSLYIILLVGLKILLHKHTGQVEIITLSPLFNANNKKYNEWVILRDFVNSDLTFKEFLMKVRQTVIDGYKNEFYPINNIIEALNITWGSLFRHSLVLENIHGKEFVVNVINKRENDLVFSFLKTPGQLEGEITFNSLMFKKETIQALFDSYLRILEQALNKTGIKIADIDLVTDEEKSEILFKFNNSKKPFPADKTIHQLFQEQVAGTPANTAVRSTLDVRNVYDKSKYRKMDIYLSYEELNDRANQLAHELRMKGVTADSIVGVMLTHPLEVVVSILGILKAGGAYLPLDVNHPEKFKVLIIENSGMQWLVTEEALHGNIPASISLNSVILVDDESSNENTTSNLELINTSTNLAYAIYTSGTTGKPKGIVVEHRGVVNYTCWRIESYQYSEKDVTLQPLSYCFDGFTSNFYSSLLSGGTLFLVPDPKRMDFQYMKEVIRDYQVTNTSLVPGIYNAILEISEKSDLESLRFVVLAGDKSGTQLVKRSKDKAAAALLINEYGPTEATVTAAASLELNEENTFIIGKPISNVSIYILDRFLKPVPVHIAGEMYISGVGVAREYLDNPGLTKEKFLKNPFIEGERMYRTGDFARWLPDGNIEFLGRHDNQVKTRGYRVELQQIENALLNHVEISDIVVLAKETKGEDALESDGKDKSLCAFYVSKREFAPNELKEYLVKELPDYMIPVHFVCLEKIPLTTNGKKDLKALAELDTNQRIEEHIAPRNELEETLVEIWVEVLRVPKDTIHINSNFFELGGHSLNATTVIYKIHKILDVKISIADLFDLPTIMQLSEYIHQAAKERYTSIDPVEKKEYYPLSSAQKRLFILNRMDTNHTGYNSPQIAALEIAVEQDKLNEVFKQLIQRHEALRTSFEIIGGEPVQKIHDDVEFNVDYFVVEEKDVNDIVNNFLQPFNMTRAPLLSVGVIKGETRPLLMVDMHHIISDAVTRDVLIRDFLSLYNGEELQELRLQYNDFSQWQNQQKESDIARESETFWLDVYDAEPPILDLPVDFPRPPIKNFEGSTLGFEIGREETEALKKIANEAEATLFMLLLAILNVLLSKLSLLEDIVVGTPVAGRAHADLENVVGLFVNTLPLRNYPLGEKTFNMFLDEVKKGTLKAFDRQWYQFEDLIEKVGVIRDTSRNPIFDVMFTYEKIETQAVEETKNHVLWKFQNEYRLENNISKFDLTLLVTEVDDRLVCGFEYCTKLFKEETIQRFEGYLKNIISTVVNDPLRKLSGIKIITPEEKQWQLVDFNDTAREYPRDKTILELFAAQVEKAPDHIAVVAHTKSGEQHLKYGELNEKAQQLASLLQAKGVKPDTIVGIKAERSMAMIIGIWGILKAGGAYLPIEPAYPEEWVNYLLTDSNVKILLTDGSSSTVNRNIDVIDLTNIDLHKYEGTPTRLTQPYHLAYVIYTSGSTGNPKGTMIQHRSLVNRLNWMQRKYPIGPDDVILQKTVFTFDVSVWELFWGSIRGATLCLLGPGDEKNPEAITEAIEKNKVTTMHFVPPMLDAYLDYLESNNESHRLAGLRQVFASGEALKNHHVDRFKRLLYETNGTRLSNLYGPTEATIDVSYYNCPMIEDPGFPMVPIGKPIDNTQLYIVDRYLELQPLGVCGELCIAGDGLARGYLNRPELAAEKFGRWHPQPIKSKKEMTNNQCPMTIYRTGDQARLLPDGNIEFLGRLDSQVKIRGFRIELGEIEKRLLDHSEIKNVVLMVKEEEGREKYLCAYIVSASKISTAELRSYLSSKLPGYMIPAYFVQLENLPLKANGKVDKRKLPAPEVQSENYMAAETDIEKTIAGVWKEALRLDKVGIHDNFFDIGGNSLQLIKVVDKLKAVLKRDIPTMAMFEHSTIRSLARHLNREDSKDQTAEKEKKAAAMKLEENSMKEAVHLFEEVRFVNEFVEQV